MPYLTLKKLWDDPTGLYDTKKLWRVKEGLEEVPAKFAGLMMEVPTLNGKDCETRVQVEVNARDSNCNVGFAQTAA